MTFKHLKDLLPVGFRVYHHDKQFEVRHNGNRVASFPTIQGLEDYAILLASAMNPMHREAL